MRWIALLPILLYRATISRIMPPCCRFQPSCSEYAYEAFRRHGTLRGGWLTLMRLLRCQPFCRAGFDPVPEKFEWFPRPGKDTR